mmetsp:Transcript_5434/g.16452  ORF Transcript_5434/g.16452 Transcript_5434/m.16452 type:complete len:277 (+) Transcript_5434:2526-3356(+)
MSQRASGQAIARRGVSWGRRTEHAGSAGVTSHRGAKGAAGWVAGRSIPTALSPLLVGFGSCLGGRLIWEREIASKQMSEGPYRPDHVPRPRHAAAGANIRAAWRATLAGWARGARSDVGVGTLSNSPNTSGGYCAISSSTRLYSALSGYVGCCTIGSARQESTVHGLPPAVDFLLPLSTKATTLSAVVRCGRPRRGAVAARPPLLARSVDADIVVLAEEGERRGAGAAGVDSASICASRDEFSGDGGLGVRAGGWLKRRRAGGERRQRSGVGASQL